MFSGGLSGDGGIQAIWDANPDIQTYLAIPNFILGDKKLIEFKEALIFGLLGVLNLEKQINCLASVTGAERNSIVGKHFNQL